MSTETAAPEATGMNEDSAPGDNNSPEEVIQAPAEASEPKDQNQSIDDIIPIKHVDDEEPEADDNTQDPAKPKAPKKASVKAADANEEKLTFRINNEERQLTRGEVQQVLNRSDWAQRGTQAYQEAAKIRKEAETIKSDYEAFVSKARVNMPQAVYDLMVEALGDPEMARTKVIQDFKVFLAPIVQEENLAPEERSARAAQRQLQRQQEALMRREQEIRSRQEQMERAEAERVGQEQEIHFQNQVAEALKPLAVPNDELTLLLYEKIKAAAAEQSIPLDPAGMASLIKERRSKLQGQSAPPTTADDRARRIAAAKQQQATARSRPGNPASASPGPRGLSGAQKTMSPEQFNKLYGL